MQQPAVVFKARSFYFRNLEFVLRSRNVESKDTVLPRKFKKFSACCTRVDKLISFLTLKRYIF